jgi:hypothetical protein
MSNTLGQEDFLGLLQQLEARCHADRTLSEEWGKAWRDYENEGIADPHALHRFREWFLLERPADALGTPPAVAWAPDAPEESSLWHRMLDSFFGIFQGMGEDQQGFPLLEDLWSGRQIRLIGEKMSMDSNGVLLGRVALGGDDYHVPLTGATFLIAPGLAEALTNDLSRIRAEQPRSRLSQRQCEGLLKPYLDSSVTQPNSHGRVEELEEILSGQSEWTPKDITTLVEQIGTHEALNTLAFETNLDLEALRRFLLSGSPQEPTPSIETDETQLDRDKTKRALDNFEQSQRARLDVDTIFVNLEKDLGLKEGTSDPYQEAVQQEEDPGNRVGLDDTPGITVLMATYLWEMEQRKVPTPKERIETITRFLDFIQEQQQGSLDPEGIQQYQLLAYLCRARTAGELDEAWSHLQDFMGWLQEGQAAAIDASPTTIDLAREVVSVNEFLDTGEEDSETMTLIATVNPLGTEGEDGEIIPILGWPEGLHVTPRKGDAIRGIWEDGRFTLKAWFPRDLLPERVPSDSAE